MSLIDDNGLETTLNGLGSKLNDMEKHAYNSRPDYNQNDETADDYIKNRPFYDTRATEEVEITFDGTLDGKEYIQIDDEVYLVKISDNAPEKESLIGETMRFFEEGTIEEYTITEDMLNVVSDDLYMIFETLVAINDTTFYGMSLSKGIWTMLGTDIYYMTYLKATKSTGELKKIDEKFIQDVIDPVQPDYNQNDKTAPDYIKNRPFYEYTTNENDILSETSIEATTQSGDLWYQSGLTLGLDTTNNSRSSVEVCCDGEVYEQVPVNYTYIGGGTYYIDIGDAETYPFKIAIGVAYFKTSGTHTLRVYELVDTKTEIVKIPIRYLPVDSGQLIRNRDSIPTGYSVSGYVETNCLTKNNTTSYTPTGDYNPATKKYVDDVKQYVNDYTIPIPSVTEEDNDKILSVVDGKPAWITINNAEGVAY